MTFKVTAKGYEWSGYESPPVGSIPTETCVCGHSVEEHGHNDEYPNSTECSECDCIAYEGEENEEENDTEGGEE